MKKCLVIILTVLMLASCNNREDKMKIITYGTVEFEQFAANAPISLDEAWELQLKYARKTYTDDFTYKLHKGNVLLFFIVDEYYVFTTKHINNKFIEGYYLSGIWVNSKNGDVFEKSIGKKIKPNYGWRMKSK